MRFRFIQMSDIPDVVHMFQEYIEVLQPGEIDYPQHDVRSLDEFALGLAHQMLSNPHWFGIVAVMGAKIALDNEGNKHVVGGRAKGFVSTILNQRPVGTPKNVAFIDLIMTDSKFYRRGAARKLGQLAIIEARKRGAQVIEGCWRPGSLGEHVWPALGLRPFRVMGAYIDEDGKPKDDLPLISGAAQHIEQHATDTPAAEAA